MTKTMLLLFIFLAAMHVCQLSNVPLFAAPRPDLMAPTEQKGKAIYEQTCLACHQADGGGVPGMNPPLANSPYVQGPAPKLIGIILNGLNDGVEIEGESYSNPMPAFTSVLKDEEIADVLTYLRCHFGNKAGPIKPVQVSRIRQGLK
jgi:mono/diheme cytochrome c family protein